MANRKSKSYRFTQATESRLKELTTYYNLTETEIIEKAVEFLMSDKFQFKFLSNDASLAHQRSALLGLSSEYRLIELEKSRNV